MLSVFGLSFFAVYVILKWRYVLPTVYGDNNVNWSVWPFSLGAGSIAMLQLVLDFPAVSSSVVYTQLFMAVYSIALPDSKAWKSCFVALLLSCAHTFKHGKTVEIAVAAILLIASVKYFHLVRYRLPK